MPKTKTSVLHAVRREVAIDPLRQFLKDNLSDDEKCDFLERMHVPYPVDPAKTCTSRQAEKTGTLGQAAETDAFKQAVKSDALEQAVKSDALEQASNTDALEEAAKTDALGQAVKSDALGQAAETDTLGSAVKNDNLQKSLMTYSLGKTVSFIGSEKTATADELRQNAVESYSGQLDTEKTLDMNKNIDYKTIYTKDIENPTIFRQNVSDNEALKEKCRDLVELVNKSTIKPRKSKSKKSFSKRNQTTDSSQNKLTDFIDVQQLLNIGYRNPELLPLIKRVSVINDIFANFSFQVQSELVSIIRIVAKTVKEFDYMKQTASNSDEIQGVVYRLLPNLNKSFCGVVLKRGSFLLDPTIRNLVEWNAVLKNLPKSTIQSSSDLFDLSSRFQTKDLIGIGKDHPEFRKTIRTILGVSSAVRYLDHGGQVEMYKILRKMENIITDLVKHKTDPEGCHDIFLTPEVLTSSLDFCIDKILMLLKASPCVPFKCFQCDLDRSNAIEESNIGSRLEVNQMMSVFDCANWGVEHDRINNLESLIHHLASKKNALDYFWSFRDCVDWFEIVRLHSRYRLETIPGMLKMYILRQILLRTLDKVENILDIARSASNEMKRTVFVSNETLSDAIALSGQIEMLTSGVEQYLKAFVVHIGNVFCLLNEYGVVSLKVRDNRLQFLTKPQWNAFNFPFLI